MGAIGKAILVLLILWVGKFIVKGIGKLVEKALSKTSLDEKLAAKIGHDANVSAGIVAFVKGIAYLFILLFALDMAKLDTVSGPLQKIFEDILEFLPKLLLAGVFGYIVVTIAGVLKQLLGDVLKAGKVDERLGSMAGTTPIANSLTTAVYAFFLLLFTPAILDLLGIDAVSEPIKNIVSQITGAVPNVLTAGIIIFIGTLIGNIAKRLISNLLQATNVDSFPQKLGLSIPATGSRSISSVVGTVVMVSIVVLTLTAAIDKLNIEILSQASEGFFSGYFRILLALIILVGGFIGARFLHDNLAQGNAALAKWAKYGVMALTTIVALNRSGIAPNLTNLPYTVAIYAAGLALGVGFAIAIGFGARDFVARWFDKKA